MSNLSIAVNADNDLYLDSGGNLAMVSGIAAVQQDCESAMKAQYGEMFLQPQDGLPTLADVWQSQNFIKWEAAARATLSAVPGVVNVASFVMSSSADTFAYAAQIETVYSSSLITISGILGGSQ